MPFNIIKHRSIVCDDWHLLRPNAEEKPEDLCIIPGKVIVPWSVWQAQRKQLQSRSDIGVWLSSDMQAALLQDDLAYFQVIAIDFPHFTDGRAYSIAYHLRTRFSYRGELRAIGDVLQDQLFYMQRVGFDAFVIRNDKNIQDALKGLSDFSETYQASADEKNPLFRRRQNIALT